MNRFRVMFGLLVLAMMILVGSGYGQDTKKDAQPAGKGPSLPTGWGKLGIVGEQKKKILDVMGSYQAKMAELKDKLSQLQKEEYTEAFKLLNDDQKGQLKRILSEKAEPIKEDKKK